MDVKIPPELKQRMTFKTLQNEEAAHPTLVDIEFPDKPCDHCGKLIQKEHYNLRQYQTPYPHWKEQCQNCKLYKNPTTGNYSLTLNEANTLFKELLAKRK